MQILVLCHLADHNLPMWKMFTSCFQVFNEESGEICFSILARCVLGDTQKSKFDHLNEMYTLLHTYRSIDMDIKTDHFDNMPTGSWRKVIKPDCEEVLATTDWIKSTLRKLSHKSYLVYDGSLAAWKSAAQATQHMVPRLLVEPLTAVHDRDEILKTILEVAQRRFTTQTWGHCMRSVWPEFEHKLDPSLKSIPRDRAGEIWSEEDDEIRGCSGDEDLLDGHGDDLEHKDNDQDDTTIDKDLTDDEQSGHDVSDEEPMAPPPKRRCGGERDFNERGESITWQQWGGIHTGNQLDAPRSSRRTQSRRDVSSAFPMVQY